MDTCRGKPVDQEKSSLLPVSKVDTGSQETRYAPKAKKRVGPSGDPHSPRHSTKSTGKENERPDTHSGARSKQTVSNRAHGIRSAQGLRDAFDRQSTELGRAGTQPDSCGNSRDSAPLSELSAKGSVRTTNESGREPNAFYLDTKRKMVEENVTVTKFPSWKFTPRQEGGASGRERGTARSCDGVAREGGGDTSVLSSDLKTAKKHDACLRSRCSASHPTSPRQNEDARLVCEESSQGVREVTPFPGSPPQDRGETEDIELRGRTKAVCDGKDVSACPQCEYSTARLGHLRQHISSVHDGKRPHKCDHCVYRAAKTSDLRRHISSVHDGKRPYECEHCDYRAPQAGHLRQHISSVHDGKRPHKCEHCDYRAAKASNLRQHISSVHDGKRPHKCEHCDYRATQASHLRRHTRTRHGGNEPAKF